MVPAWPTVTQGSRVLRLNFSLTRLFSATHALPLSSLLCSWGPLCSWNAPTRGFLGAPGFSTLETSALLVRHIPISGVCRTLSLGPQDPFRSCPLGCFRLSFRLWLKCHLFQETFPIALMEAAIPSILHVVSSVTFDPCLFVGRIHHRRTYSLRPGTCLFHLPLSYLQCLAQSSALSERRRFAMLFPL